jgi:hypothetical protein
LLAHRYQAGLVTIGRSYYIVFFTGDVVLNDNLKKRESSGTARSPITVTDDDFNNNIDDLDCCALFADVCRKEVAAVALIPTRYASYFTPQSIGGLALAENKQRIVEDKDRLPVRGVIVNDSTGELEETTFDILELVGSGGEGDAGGGLGMAHRFAMGVHVKKAQRIR